jgi:hypothetical protein
VIAALLVVGLVNSHRTVRIERNAPGPGVSRFAPSAAELGCLSTAALVRPDGLISLDYPGQDPRTVASWHCSDPAGRHPSLAQLLRGAPGEPYQPLRTLVPLQSSLSVIGLALHRGALTMTVVTPSGGGPGDWAWLGNAWELRFTIGGTGALDASTVRLVGVPCTLDDLVVSASTPWPGSDPTARRVASAQLRFINTSSADCVLSGYPRLTAFSDELTYPAIHTMHGSFGGIFSDTDPPIVLLSPRAPATAVVESSAAALNATAFIAPGCPAAARISVGLPDDGGAVTIAFPIAVCGLEVHPVTFQLFEPTG